MVLGAWLVTEADRELLQLLVGVVVLAGAGVQALGPPRPGRGRPALEVGGGLAAGALTTSVSVNGPAVLLVLTRPACAAAPCATRSPPPCSDSACWRPVVLSPRVPTGRCLSLGGARLRSGAFDRPSASVPPPSAASMTTRTIAARSSPLRSPAC